MASNGLEIVKEIFAPFQAKPILTADFTVGGARRSAILTISQIDMATGRRSLVERHDVAGKRDARALAARLGAKPWNF